ncbi:MAG: hypothetical protein CL946_04765 [Ectothiorhodospiraceae bacterium]|nr:hypothetical protein [Ectothiorhodospiraceae bacterium]
MNYEYVKNYYGVPAEYGRIVIVAGERGVIVEDRGNYIGVLFDKDKPGVISNCHPTWEVEYCGIGKPRKMTRSQQRYQRYLEYGDSFDNFRQFLSWDCDKERSWNK